ncbi:MAG: ferrous iron transport protein B [Proteobacteria bacterium]|nr:ferrous iron transport protein B [Pseudomonadota bacterium]
MNHTAAKNDSGETGLPKVLLVGNPNVGKSVTFGYLTGSYVTVSNYPGTTVEVSRGKATINKKLSLIIDTPGVNSLLPMSEDEEVTRNILLDEHHDSIVQVADAKNLKRSLTISLQLAEMGLSFLLDLNLYDEALSRGISIDTKRLSEILGVDAFTTVATRRQGMDKLLKAIEKPRISGFQMDYGVRIEESLAHLEELLPESYISKRSIALMVLAGDATLTDWLHEKLSPAELERVEVIRRQAEVELRQPVSYLINRQRSAEIDKIVDEVYSVSDTVRGGFRNWLGNMMMHPVWGVPFLFAVLAIMYLFVGVLGAGTMVDFLETQFFDRYITPWSTKLADAFIPFEIIRDFLVGEYGLITMALSYAIAIVFPVVGTFFIAFSILEDSGYLPRLAVMVNKIFRLMGLNGKAVLPMVLGLGCDTMATMTTRILDTKKDRIIVTLLLALGVPCSAQLGVILGMLGGISFNALLFWVGTVSGVLFLVGYLSAKVLPGDASDFIYELPPVRLPHMKNIFFKTIARIDWYMREAVPLFILGTLTLFVLDKLNALVLIEKIASPLIVTFLGLPEKAAEAFLIGFLRRDYGAAGLYALQRDGLLDPLQTVVSLVTMTLFIPCIANLFMIVKERGIKTAFWITAFILPFALLVGGVVNFVLRATGVDFK